MKIYEVIEDEIEYEIKEYADGSKHWYFDNKRHRMNGPACEWSDGSKFWYFDDKCHRINGPAIEYVSGNKYWYIHGKHYPTKKEYYLELVKRGLISKKEAFIELI